MAEAELEIELRDGAVAEARWRGEAGQPTVVLVHGLTGHMNEHLHYNAARYFEECGWASVRFNLYGMHPRARRLLDCTPSIHARDIDDVVAYVRQRSDGGRVGLVGHSLGGLSVLLTESQVDAASLWDATNPPTVPPLDSVHQLEGTTHMVWPQRVHHLLGSALLDEVRSLEGTQLAKEWRHPIQFIAASSGARPDVAERLYQAANRPKQLVVVEESDHTFSRDGNDEALFGATFAWLAPYLDI